MFEAREYRATGRTPEQLTALFEPLLGVLREVDAIHLEAKTERAKLDKGPSFDGMYDEMENRRLARVESLGAALYKQALSANDAIRSRIEAGEPVDDAHRVKHSLMCSLLLALGHSKKPQLNMPRMNIFLYGQSNDDGIGFHPTSNNLVEIDLSRPDSEAKPVTLVATLLHLTEEVERTTGLSLEESQLIVSRLVKRTHPELIEETEEQFTVRRAIEIMVLNARMKRMYHETEAERRRAFGLLRKELVRDMYRRWIVGGRSQDEGALIQMEEIIIPGSGEPFLKFWITTSESGQIDFMVPKRLCAGLDKK